MLDRGIGENNHCHKNKAASTSLLKINLIKPLKRMETILTIIYISEKNHKKIIFPFIFETLFSKPAQSNQHCFQREKCTQDTTPRQVAAAAVATWAYKLPSLQLKTYNHEAIWRVSGWSMSTDLQKSFLFPMPDWFIDVCVSLGMRVEAE